LSTQVSSLESAGLVGVRKEFFGKTPRTLLSVTSEGRTAWFEHLAALQRVVDSQLQKIKGGAIRTIYCFV